MIVFFLGRGRWRHLFRVIAILPFLKVISSFPHRFLPVLNGRGGAVVQASKALRATVAPNGTAVFQSDVVGWADFDADATADATVGGAEGFAAHFESAEKRVDDARFQKLLSFLQITVNGRVGSDSCHNPFERWHGIGLFFLFKVNRVGVEAREHYVGVWHLHRVDVAAQPALAAEKF